MGTSAGPRTDATMSSTRPARGSRAPLRKRLSMSVRDCTFTSPRTPCGAPTTPTTGSSVNLEVDLGPIARGHHFEKRANGLRDPSTAADHLSNVRFGNLQMELRSEERRVGKECRSRWSPYH